MTYSLVRDTFAEYTGHLVERPNVQYLNDEGRSYLGRSQDRFDIINFVSPDSYSASNSATSSAFVMSESYLYTVEMVMECLAHLNDDGFIVMELGEHEYERRPYRTLSYLSTAREALHRMGMTDFEDHVLLVRAPVYIPTSVILVKKSPFSKADIDRVSTVVAKVADAQIAFAPGQVALPGPATEIITIPYDRLPAWHDAYRYDVGPVYDDSPFFWHFVRFRDVISDRQYGEAALLVETDFENGAGERVLIFTLKMCAVFASIVLLLPFVLLRGTWRALPCKARSTVYFATLGLGFMAFEISLIQKFTLLLGYPTYSLTLTLAAMLSFAGFGSLFSSAYRGRTGTIGVALLLVVGACTAFYQFGLPMVVDAVIGWPLAVRGALCIAMLAPLGFALGAFMPLGLRIVAGLTEHKVEYVAWGWAVNGFFSVIGSTLTTILSMAYGFGSVLYFALALYTVGAIALALMPRPSP
ncbi:MAG: hypothetical protein FJY92_06050, partial [Candidatus Hydrogenedentes bacterium]|nr:hypothetical protein [Candidatus Hydrogenedentota bacterium]